MIIIEGKNGRFIATRRKYAKLWVPVVVTPDGKRIALAHVSTSHQAASVAINKAKTLAGII